MEETLGIEGGLHSDSDDAEENVYYHRLSSIFEIVITMLPTAMLAAWRSKGFMMRYDGSEHRFKMHWAERMNGSIEVVAPVG
jgi:hypothetical protein